MGEERGGDLIICLELVPTLSPTSLPIPFQRSAWLNLQYVHLFDNFYQLLIFLADIVQIILKICLFFSEAIR